MGINRFFDQDVVVRRLKDISGDKESFAATATVGAHIQGLDDEARQRLDISEERAWKAWFDVDVDLIEGDIIVDESGVEYEVREITRKNYSFGVNQHTEVVLMEQNG